MIGRDITILCARESFTVTAALLYSPKRESRIKISSLKIFETEHLSNITELLCDLKTTLHTCITCLSYQLTRVLLVLPERSVLKFRDCPHYSVNSFM